MGNVGAVSGGGAVVVQWWCSGGGASGRVAAACPVGLSLIPLGARLFLFLSISGKSLIRSLVEVQCLLTFLKILA